MGERSSGNRRLGAFRDGRGASSDPDSSEFSAISRKTASSRSLRSRRRCARKIRLRSSFPPHTLKGEARQLGAEPLAKIAELIETTARFCVENHRFPDELVPEVVELRTLFNETVELFDKATNPLKTRTAPTGFGRKVTNQGFGRI